MVTDRSDGFADTWGFLDRRLEDVAVAGKTVGDVGEFVGFSLRAAGNVLRSKGVGFF